MAKYRSYQEVKEVLDQFNITFTGKARVNYRKTASAFASRAQSWSDSRLAKELQYLIQKDVSRTRYGKLREIKGIESREARKASSFSFERFKNYKRARQYFSHERSLELSKSKEKTDSAIAKVTYDKDVPTRIRDKAVIDQRTSTWAYWSHKQNHPERIKNLAYEINQSRFNLDPDSKPGWAVAYYHYLYNIDIETLIEETDYNQYMPTAYSVMVNNILG